jgi:type II secretory pathway component PulF
MLDDVIFGLNKWEKIYDWIKKYTDIVPSNVTVMIKVWEETANLENSLSNILKMYENELNNLINNLAKVIEPILLIFIWWFIVLIALWVFGLILQIMDNVWNI